LAKKDVILKAGVVFDPKDVDTKGIKRAIATAAAEARVQIKIREARVLRQAITSINRDLAKAIKVNLKGANFTFNAASIAAGLGRVLKEAGRQHKLFLQVDRASLKAQIASVLEEVGAKPVRVKTKTEPERRAAPARPVTTGTEVEQLTRTVQAEKELIAATPQAVKAQSQLNNILKNSGTSAEQFGAKIAQVTTRFAAYAVAIRAIFAVQNAFNKSLQAIVAFDDTIQDLNKVLNETPAGLQNVARGMFQVAQETGRSFSDVATALNIFIRQGLGAEEALDRVRATMVATNITELNAAEATRFLTTVTRVYSEEAGNLERVLDVLSVTADNAATTAGALAQSFINSGAAAKAVGVSYQELFAVTAAAIEQTQQSGSKIGTALKTIFSRLVTMNEEIRKQANAWGANITASDGVVEVFGKLAQVYKRLDIFQRGQLAYLVSGRRRFTELAGILQGFEKAQGLIEKQLNAGGTAARKNQVELQKLSTQARQLTNTWNELLQALAGTEGGAEGAGIIRETLGEILSVAQSVSTGLLEITRLLGGLSTEGVGVSSIFTAIAKSAFFVIGIRIIRGIVNGMRQFLQIGQVVKGMLAQLAGGSSSINRFLLAGNRLLDTRIGQNRVLIQQNRELSGLAQQRNITLGAGIAGRAEAGRRGGGRAGATGALRGGAGLAVITGLSVGFQALGDFTRQMSEDFEKLGESVGIVSNALADSGSSFANWGQLFTFVGGPVIGIIGGISAGLISFTASVKRAEEATLKNLAAIEKATGTQAAVSVAQARRLGGDLVADAADEISQGIRGARANLVNVLIRATADSQDDIANAIESTADLINVLNNRLQSAIRSVQIERELKNFEKNLREKISTLEFEATVNVPGAAAGFAQAMGQVRTNVEALTGPLESQAAIFEKIKDANAALREITSDQQNDLGEILRIYGFISDQTETIELELRAANIAVENQAKAIESVNTEQGKLNAAIKEAEKREKQLSESIDASGKGYEAIKESQKAVAQLTAERESRERELQQLVAEEERLLGVASRAQEALTQQYEEDKKLLIDIVKSQRQLIGEIDVATAQAKKSTSEHKFRTDLLQEELEFRRAINALEEDSEFRTDFQRAIEQANRDASQSIAEREREQIAALEVIEQAIVDAEKAGNDEAVKDFKRRLAEQREAFDAELGELESKVNLEALIKVEEAGSEEIIRRREILTEMEISDIQRVADAEVEASARRVAAIQEISRQFNVGQVFERELSRIPDVVITTFGELGALIVTEQTRAAEDTVRAISAEYDKLKTIVKDPLSRAQEAETARQRVLTEGEKILNAKRQAILDRSKSAADKANKAEKDLVDARNQIPALNAKIIEAEKNLSQARQSQEDAVSNFFKASQAAADAQAQYNFELANAQAQVVINTAGAGSFATKLAALGGVWSESVRGVRASEEQILQIRSQIAQQSLSIMQQQFNAFKSLALRAATATDEELFKLQQGLGAAQAVAGGLEVGALPDELRSSLTEFSGVIEGLEEALVEQGAERLGLDPSVFKSMENQMLELARVSAENGKANVDAAVEQVRLAMTQIAKADEQVRQAKEQVKISTQERDQAVIQANRLSSIQSLAARQHTAIVTEGNKQLTKLNSIDASSKLVVEELRRLNEEIRNLKNIRIPAVQTEGAAGGTLSPGELAGLASAARREKAAMPGGARLMMANTSEVVLNRRQARRLGMAPRPKRYAADGNAVGGVEFTNAVNTLSGAVGALMTRLDDPNFVNQNISVQVDSRKKIDVSGVEGVRQSVVEAFQDRMGEVASREEVQGIGNIIADVVGRLHEQGIVNSRGE
jgi:TP901 family phage tail tape measure protein